MHVRSVLRRCAVALAHTIWHGSSSFATHSSWSSPVSHIGPICHTIGLPAHLTRVGTLRVARVDEAAAQRRDPSSGRKAALDPIRPMRLRPHVRGGTRPPWLRIPDSLPGRRRFSFRRRRPQRAFGPRPRVGGRILQGTSRIVARCGAALCEEWSVLSATKWL
jgi:hypothetical protein